MKENEKRRLRYDLLVVSLLSSVDCEVVSGFLWVVLVLVGWFWGWVVLERGWREMVRIWKDGSDRKKRGEHLMAIFSSNWKITGIQLPERGKELMAHGSLNSRFWCGNGLFWLSRLPSAASCGESCKDGMNSSNQEFDFPGGKGSASVGKILLVEDTEINRVLLRKLFRDLNLLLEEAENGQIAVDYFKQGKNYDLVLMDKEMPVMDGHEATRQLRSLGVKTPIIALTGNSLQSDKDMFFQAGADEFQTKPLSRVELVRLLARYGLDGPTSAITPL